MGKRDFLWLSVLAAAILLLSGRALLDPGFCLFNFGDLYSFHYPLRHLVKSELEAGRLPFWNPFILGGLPLLADTQSAAFDPAALPGIFFPLSLGLSWECAFWIFWAGLGCYLLARSSGLAPWAAAAACGFFAFSPFLIYRVTEGIPTLLASLAWVPWTWLAFLSARPSLLAAALSLQFFSGHPQFLFINLLGMALWAAVRGDAKRRMVVLAAAGAALAALTSAEWVPFREFLERSVRSFWPPIYAAAYALSARESAGWIFPWLLKTPFHSAFVGPPSVFFETSGAWLGSAGIALAAWGLIKEKARGFRKGAALLLAAGLILAAAPRLGWLGKIGRVGILQFTRTPSRNALLCLWGMWMLACAGLKGFAAFIVRSKKLEVRSPKTFSSHFSLLTSHSPILKILAILSLAELLLWDRPFLRSQENVPYLRVNPLLAEKISMRPFRILTDPELPNPDKTMLYRAMNVNGYSDLYLAGYARAASAAEGRAAADASRTYITAASAPPMRELAVAGCIGPRGRFRRCGQTLRLAHFLGGRGAPLSVKPKAKVRWQTSRWRVEGTWPREGAALALALPFYPGWRGRMAWEEKSAGGRGAHPIRLEPRIGFLTKLARPAGLPNGARFALDLGFETRGWPLWAALSAAAWAALLASMLRRGAAYASH